MQDIEKKKLSKALGYRIRGIRVQKGLSQEKFSETVNADRTYVCKIENGKSNLTVWKLCEICELLGLTLKEFFNNDEFLKKYIDSEE